MSQLCHTPSKPDVLYLQILTPMQSARSSIEVYPYHQDVFAIVDCIAMQASGSYGPNLHQSNLLVDSVVHSSAGCPVWLDAQNIHDQTLACEI